MGLPLVEGREPLTVLPDGSDLDRLGAALALGGAVVVMKPSRLSAQAVALLEETGAAARALVAENVTLADERVFRPASATELASLPYFSLVVIPPAGRGVHPNRTDEEPSSRGVTRL
jgi:precorrin-2/cobalt-factor-2 C20-methyltransferase